MGMESERSGGEVVPVAAEIEKPLRDGHTIHAFSTGGGLRAIRITNPEGVSDMEKLPKLKKRLLMQPWIISLGTKHMSSNIAVKTQGTPTIGRELQKSAPH